MKKKMFSYLIIFVVLLALPYIFSLFRKNIINNDQIIVGTSCTYPPYEYLENGEFKGFDIDVMKEVGKRIGKEIIFQDLDFNVLILKAQSGAIHIIAAALTPTAERSEQVLFTKPYTGSDPLVAVSKSSLNINTINDLLNKKIAVLQGYTGEAFMNQYKNINLLHLITPAEAIFALSTGKVDVYVSALSSIKTFLDKADQEYNLFYLDAYDNYAFAVSPRYKELLPEIQQILDEMENDGTLMKLRKEWGIGQFKAMEDI